MYLLLLMQIIYLVLIFDVSYLLFFGSSAQLRLIEVDQFWQLSINLQRNKVI
jgi:hypothetical protein